MKRIFALALAICMALSMMVLTASAALHPDAACTHNPNSDHWQYAGTNSYDSGSDQYEYDGNSYSKDDETFESWSPSSVWFVDGHLPTNADAGKWWYKDASTGYSFKKCPGNHGPQPAPQPKTGVLDTLPLWFGVMAVSACAYVLTSKKKVF